MVKRVHGTAEDIQADVSLMGVLQDWVTGHVIHNMFCERLLSAFRRNVNSTFQRPTCKRLMASGLLNEILTTHRLAGGADPRSLTREDVAIMGIQTASSSSKKTIAVDKAPPSWRYVRAVESQRNQRLPKQQFHAERKRLCQEFASLDEAEKSAYMGVNDIVAEPQSVDPDQEYQSKIQGNLWFGSDRKQPIRADVIESELGRHVAPTKRSSSSGEVP